MPNTNETNPANLAAQQALERLYAALQQKQNFIFEAGAGAGKTYSLIKALQFLIRENGKAYDKAHKRIACITFTNVAKEQIDSRTDKNPIIHTDTIHAFSWSLIRNFQDELRKALLTLEKWPPRLLEYHNELLATENSEGEIQTNNPEEPQQEIDYKACIGKKEIKYQLGYPKIDDDCITLSHDDVLHLMIHLLTKEKFRNVLFSKYPVILVDEYQDTFKGIADALQDHFVNTETGPQVGFFGDNWQKIYGAGCGKIDNEKLLVIPKNANFRSVATIVNVLNAMRPGLMQEVENPDSIGFAKAYHTNEWVGRRRTGNHWGGDLPAEDAHKYLVELRSQLSIEGWDFGPEKTKILMLTHNVLAQEQGYKELADVFSNNEAFIKKEDKFIAYFVDFLEPICEAFENKKYGVMFSLIGAGKFGIHSHSQKVEWTDRMTSLLEIRDRGTIGEVLEFLLNGSKPKLPENIVEACKRSLAYIEVEGQEMPSEIERIRNLWVVPYKQVIAIKNFVNDHTPFATKHSVKGEEFENVLVVVGRGWNQYNFDQMLAYFNDGITPGREDAFERSRNLFYVSCSRPTTRLAILFTQLLSDSAAATLNSWLGDGNVISLGTVPITLN
ncbi:MAG: ATP-dependent helicase [Bacteroidetes bacterium]|nr:ATP-dependent helicase [Bacteroidota bacterium]